jgi:hypothetical protein
MNRSSLRALSLSAAMAVAWTASIAAGTAPPARAAAASDAASAVRHKPAKRKKVVVVRRTRPAVAAAPAIRVTPAALPAPTPTIGPPSYTAPVPSGPSIIGPSAAASAGGPGFAVIPNPVGAASSSPPRPDAGAPTDPRMR